MSDSITGAGNRALWLSLPRRIPTIASECFGGVAGLRLVSLPTLSPKIVWTRSASESPYDHDSPFRRCQKAAALCVPRLVP